MNRFIPIFALLMSGCLVGQEDANCDFADSCFECLERDGCGWCPAGGGRCVDGSSLGPDVSACTDYRWDTCATPFDPCAVHRSCDRCVLAASCGWCPELGGGRCSVGECFGRTDICGPPSCENFFSCGTCAANDGCEWASRLTVCNADDCNTELQDGFCRANLACR